MEHTHHTHTHSHTHTLQHKHTENRLLCSSRTYISQVGEVTHKHLSKDIRVKWPKNLQRLPVPNPTTHMSRKPERRTKFKVEYPWASLPIIKEFPTPRLKLTQLFPYKKKPKRSFSKWHPRSSKSISRAVTSAWMPKKQQQSEPLGSCKRWTLFPCTSPGSRFGARPGRLHRECVSTCEELKALSVQTEKESSCFEIFLLNPLNEPWLVGSVGDGSFLSRKQTCCHNKKIWLGLD